MKISSGGALGGSGGSSGSEEEGRVVLEGWSNERSGGDEGGGAGVMTGRGWNFEVRARGRGRIETKDRRDCGWHGGVSARKMCKGEKCEGWGGGGNCVRGRNKWKGMGE